jgi:hypothetical protein
VDRTEPLAWDRRSHDARPVSPVSPSRPSPLRFLARAATLGVALGFLGSYVWLAAQRHWSPAGGLSGDAATPLMFASTKVGVPAVAADPNRPLTGPITLQEMIEQRKHGPVERPEGPAAFEAKIDRDRLPSITDFRTLVSSVTRPPPADAKATEPKITVAADGTLDLRGRAPLPFSHSLPPTSTGVRPSVATPVMGSPPAPSVVLASSKSAVVIPPAVVAPNPTPNPPVVMSSSKSITFVVSPTRPIVHWGPFSLPDPPPRAKPAAANGSAAKPAAAKSAAPPVPADARTPAPQP